MFKVLTAIVLAFILAGCTPTDSKIEVEKIIYDLNLDHRTAHMTNDANLLVAQMSDTIYNIQDGAIYTSAKSDVLKRFEKYFSTVKYKKWDDIEKPLIKVSEKGDHATLMVRKEIEVAPVVGDSIGAYEGSIWAWSASYEKKDRQWYLYLISAGKESKRE